MDSNMLDQGLISKAGRDATGNQQVSLAKFVRQYTTCDFEKKFV